MFFFCAHRFPSFPLVILFPAQTGCKRKAGWQAVFSPEVLLCFIFRPLSGFSFFLSFRVTFSHWKLYFPGKLLGKMPHYGQDPNNAGVYFFQPPSPRCAHDLQGKKATNKKAREVVGRNVERKQIGVWGCTFSLWPEKKRGIEEEPRRTLNTLVSDCGVRQGNPETHPWIVSHVLSLRWSKGAIFKPFPASTDW